MDILSGKLIGFVLISVRIGAFLALSPLFSWQAIPMRIKAALACILTIFFSSITPCAYNSTNTTLPELIILMSNELVYGMALGFVTVLIFSAVKLGAGIIERQMGLSMANILDPLSGETAQPLAMLMEMIFILLFLNANGHHIFLMTIARSYESFAIGASPSIERLTEGLVVSGSTVLMLGLRISAPILAAFLLALVILAILAKIAPDMNILFVSLPVRVGMGLLMTGIFIPFINGFVKEFTGWMGKLLPL